MEFHFVDEKQDYNDDSSSSSKYNVNSSRISAIASPEENNHGGKKYLWINYLKIVLIMINDFTLKFHVF